MLDLLNFHKYIFVMTNNNLNALTARQFKLIRVLTHSDYFPTLWNFPCGKGCLAFCLKLQNQELRKESLMNINHKEATQFELFMNSVFIP